MNASHINRPRTSYQRVHCAKSDEWQVTYLELDGQHHGDVAGLRGQKAHGALTILRMQYDKNMPFLGVPEWFRMQMQYKDALQQ